MNGKIYPQRPHNIEQPPNVAAAIAANVCGAFHKDLYGIGLLDASAKNNTKLTT